MEFVQIIQYQTSKPEEVQALGEEYSANRMAEGDGTPPSLILTVKDRDRENTYMTIVRFASYEAAMENSARADTSELAGKMAALCDGPPTFFNLDLVAENTP